MRCVPNRKQFQLMLRRSLKQTGDSCQGFIGFQQAVASPLASSIDTKQRTPFDCTAPV
jgi:hypothetical protein